jgi:nucleotide-binding universal stress UspA family protein
MKKILCPTDFSDTAYNAITYAAKFAQATGASLTLLYIQSPLKSGAIFSSEKEQIKSAASEKLKELSEEVHRSFKISCDIDVFQSTANLSNVIVSASSAFELIVMGTNGVEDLLEFLAGNHTYNVIRKSKIPVMLIPASYMYSEIKNIVYAYNYLTEHKLPLSQLLEWTKHLDCEITVLQVNEEIIGKNVQDEMKKLQTTLTSQWEKEGVQLNFDSIRSSDVAPSINSYMHRNQYDVLAFCTTHENFVQRLFHKSVIKITSAIADYPVLVLHE